MLPVMRKIFLQWRCKKKHGQVKQVFHREKQERLSP